MANVHNEEVLFKLLDKNAVKRIINSHKIERDVFQRISQITIIPFETSLQSK